VAVVTTLLRSETYWYCPRCSAEDVTFESKPHTRFHACPGTRGLTVAFLPKGTKAKVTIEERQDYVGNELVQLDPEKGRPVMAVVTERDDGIDRMVYAPTATGHFGE
jgi:hypothetical protein